MYLAAMGNSKGIVKRLRIEKIDATKSTTMIADGFNEYGKLDIQIDRNV